MRLIEESRSPESYEAAYENEDGSFTAVWAHEGTAETGPSGGHEDFTAAEWAVMEADSLAQEDAYEAMMTTLPVKTGSFSEQA